ncbi:MAG TPA: DegT/DnrJ/EryC1/StrS family aminotransferase, partial [Patescibacteria group bacterium]|nr:DegT/DnrJ/EryC1/StrS family aminotransferase [Patescibacteria group bacterium]
MKKIPLFKVFIPRETDREILKTLHSGYIAEGEKVKEFGKAVAKFIGNPYVVPVSSCTMALTIAYELAGIGRGDEVISTPLTCIATNTPLLQLGAKIVWADCESITGMIDPEQLEKLITPKTKAIVVLHKDGELARMDEIVAIARRHKIKIIEDAAHVFGAKYRGKKVGTLSDYACFSFQAIKHVTTGDGGALVCKTKADYLRARKFKWFGIDKEAPHKNKNIWMDPIDIVGYKGNMHDISATIGLVQIKYAKKIIETYHRNGELYHKLFNIKSDRRNYAVYWTYTTLVENRAKVMKALEREGIASGIIHPRNDLYPIFKSSKRSLPGVDFYAKRELSLPCGWWVTKRDIKKI